MVRIAHLLDKMPGQCSGGESQRVALARTLVTNPSTFLLDEPLSSLDAKLRRELRAECDRLHEELKRTFIFVTHDQEEAMTLADRIVVMRDGEIEQVGSPMEIYSDPVSYFVADFFGSPSMNLVAGEVVGATARLRFRAARFDVRAAGALQATRRPAPATLGIRPEHVGVAPRRRAATIDAAGAAGRAARQGYAALFRRRHRARLRRRQRRAGDGGAQAGRAPRTDASPRPHLPVRRRTDGASAARPNAARPSISQAL